MYHTAKMEQFSRAYVFAIAAQAGCNSSRPEVDDDSVDLELCMKDIPNCKWTRGRIAIQLKCTHAVDCSKDEIAFALPVKNYNDLRAAVMEPRLLVLVCVPEACEDWIKQTEDQLCLYHCAYWLSLAGKPETKNDSTVTVHIPRKNVFSVDFLKEAMRHSANGEMI